MTERISRFTVPDLADVPEDVRNRILAVQEKAGFVPNVFLCWRTARPSSAPSSTTTTR